MIGSLRVGRHLAARFFGALDPRGPAPADEAWARAQLIPGEVALWGRMSGPDRRHAVGVARRVVEDLGFAGDVPRWAVAAALLHDVGKVEARLGTLGRVPATLVGLAGVGRYAGSWAARPVTSVRGRVGRYLRHTAIGGELLEAAGSDERTAAWAREHHLPSDRWTLPRPVAAALKSADDD